MAQETGSVKDMNNEFYFQNTDEDYYNTETISRQSFHDLIFAYDELLDMTFSDYMLEIFSSYYHSYKKNGLIIN